MTLLRLAPGRTGGRTLLFRVARCRNAAALRNPPFALVRTFGVLLLVALAGLAFVLEEVRFVLAGLAIQALVEIGLALRARRGRAAAAAGDRTRVCAARISCVEKEGALVVTLTGGEQGRRAAPYVLLSRALRPGAPDVGPRTDAPYLELSDPKWSVHGGIQEAYLSPQLLQLTLDERGAAVLRASEIRVTLDTPGEQRRLERALSRVLRGVPFTSDRTIQPAAADA